MPSFTFQKMAYRKMKGYKLRRKMPLIANS